MAVFVVELLFFFFVLAMKRDRDLQLSFTGRLELFNVIVGNFKLCFFALLHRGYCRKSAEVLFFTIEIDSCDKACILTASYKVAEGYKAKLKNR